MNLSISNNCLEIISNETFIHLFNLYYLNLASNKLNSKSRFTVLSNLAVLDLNSNQIESIRKYDFDGLKNMKILDFKSNPIENIQPGSLDAFGSGIFKLSISMPNISIENIYSMKDSLKPQMVRKFVHIKYFAPAHIENRVKLSDLNCVKTLYFMRFKILYNFFNEHIDINDFLSNCMNLSNIRQELDRIENSSIHLNISNQNNQQTIGITHLEDRLKNMIIFCFIFFSFFISISFLFVKIILKIFKTKNNQLEPIELSSKCFIHESANKTMTGYKFRTRSKNLLGPKEKISNANVCLTDA